MPEVAFHTGVADKLGYACRLLRKAWRQQARVTVTGDAALLAQLDTLLWTFDPQEFIPHARLRAGQAPSDALAPTPIWLAEAGAATPAAEVLVNLGPEPADTSGYARVIELVGTDDDERQAGRRRWRAHESLGQAVTHHPQDARS
jgi:DNA polymerase-3 subunit chi